MVTSVTWREAEAPSMPAAINPFRNSDILAEGAVMYGNWSILRNIHWPLSWPYTGRATTVFPYVRTNPTIRKIAYGSRINWYHLWTSRPGGLALHTASVSGQARVVNHYVGAKVLFSRRYSGQNGRASVSALARKQKNTLLQLRKVLVVVYSLMIKGNAIRT